jgi:uncharacterized protein YndB with AHSA1/START domain/general stress protein 26
MTGHPRPTRPRMPESYGVSGDPAPDQPGAWTRIVERVAAARNYWVSTTRPDGRPHAMPVWAVWLDGGLHFTTARASRKACNLRHNSAIVIHLESGDDALILEGVVEEVRDPGTFQRYAAAYEDKYQWHLEGRETADVTYVVRPRVVFAWSEAAFPASATRWLFDTDDDAGSVRRALRIPAAPPVVFAFLTDPAKIRRWFGVEAAGDARPGASYRRIINAGHVVSGTYLELVPDHRIVCTWGWVGSEKLPPGSTVVEIELRPDGGGTQLQLTHRDPVTKSGEGHAEIWDHYLPRLAIASSGGNPGPDPWGSG